MGGGRADLPCTPAHSGGEADAGVGCGSSSLVPVVPVGLRGRVGCGSSSLVPVVPVGLRGGEGPRGGEGARGVNSARIIIGGRGGKGRSRSPKLGLPKGQPNNQTTNQLLLSKPPLNNQPTTLTEPSLRSTNQPNNPDYN